MKEDGKVERIEDKRKAYFKACWLRKKSRGFSKNPLTNPPPCAIL
jgi:hypothetical protein